MHDDQTTKQRKSTLAEFAAMPAKSPPKPTLPKEDEEVEEYPGFGFLRGVRERGMMVEFRFRDGNSDFFSYSLLSFFRYVPSEGVLLKFSGDLVTLVLIHGSNLDLPVSEYGVNLTDRGLQRHKITFIREMDEDELRQAGNKQPTIDKIEVAEFQSHEEAQAWLKTHAPVFVREEGVS